MTEWQFEHSLFTIANRNDAWAYWSDMRNHATMEPGVERIELDGPFTTGTTGRTIAKDFTQEWELVDVVDGRCFTVIGWTPDGQGSLSFTWEFEDEGGGTRMTYRIRATGPEVGAHLEEFRAMEVRAPEGMADLAAALDRLAQEKGHSE